MSTVSLQQQLSTAFFCSESAILLWHDTEGVASQLLDATELPNDITAVFENESPRFELICKLNSLAPDERVLLVRPRRKRVEADDWFADIEAFADNFDVDAARLPREERSIFNRALHAHRQTERNKAYHELREARREANQQAWWSTRYGMDAPKPEPDKAATGSAPRQPHQPKLPSFDADWYPRETFQQTLLDAGFNLEMVREDWAASQAGFTLFDDCVIRGTWDSPDTYFQSLLSDPLVPRASISKTIQAAPSFVAFLYASLQDGTILDYDDDTWITPAGLRELEISTDDFAVFADEVAAACRESDIPYITLHRLRRSSPQPALLDYELSDRFYEAALFSQKGRIDRGKLCGTRFFAPLGTPTRGRDMLAVMVERERSIDLEDLLDLLRNDYGFPITRTQLLQLVRASSVFYSPELDRVYCDHERFILEVE